MTGWPRGACGHRVAPVPLTAGNTATVELLVEEGDTALAQRSGTLQVLGTPRVVALVEEACVAAVGDELEPGQTTVGMKVQLDHLAPTALGRTVVAQSSIESINGRRISFQVSVSDDRGLVAVGRVTRVIVDIERFLDKAG
jgi:fluoroacetyl-CoA thioesterase